MFKTTKALAFSQLVLAFSDHISEADNINNFFKVKGAHDQNQFQCKY